MTMFSGFRFVCDFLLCRKLQVHTLELEGTPQSAYAPCSVVFGKQHVC